MAVLSSFMQRTADAPRLDGQTAPPTRKQRRRARRKRAPEAGGNLKASGEEVGATSPSEPPASEPAQRTLQSRLLLDTETTHKDLRLVNRAIDERWPMEPMIKHAVLSRLLARGLTEKDIDKLVDITNTMLRAEKQNQDDQLARMKQDDKTPAVQQNVMIVLPDNNRGDTITIPRG